MYPAAAVNVALAANDPDPKPPSQLSASMPCVTVVVVSDALVHADEDTAHDAVKLGSDADREYERLLDPAGFDADTVRVTLSGDADPAGHVNVDHDADVPAPEPDLLPE